MSDLEQRVAALRQEMDSLKAALQTASNETERSALHMRLNDCIRASMRLIDERLQAHSASLAERHRSTSRPSSATTTQHEPLRERSVGDHALRAER